MPIQIACPGCSKQFRVADEHAGKKVKCPGCSTVFQVPVGRESPSGDPAPGDPPSPADSSVTPRPAPRDSHSPGAYQPAAAQGSPYQPSQHAAAPRKPVGEELTDAERTMGTISVVLGGISLVGVVVPFFFFCCCGALAAIIPAAMTVPAGIGLALAFKSKGGLKTAGIVTNSIALGIGVLALIGVVVLFVVYGGAMAMQMQQQNQGGGF